MSRTPREKELLRSHMQIESLRDVAAKLYKEASAIYKQATDIELEREKLKPPTPESIFFDLCWKPFPTGRSGSAAQKLGLPAIRLYSNIWWGPDWVVKVSQISWHMTTGLEHAARSMQGLPAKPKHNTYLRARGKAFKALMEELTEELK